MVPEYVWLIFPTSPSQSCKCPAQSSTLLGKVWGCSCSTRAEGTLGKIPPEHSQIHDPLQCDLMQIQMTAQVPVTVPVCTDCYFSGYHMHRQVTQHRWRKLWRLPWASLLHQQDVLLLCYGPCQQQSYGGKGLDKQNRDSLKLSCRWITFSDWSLILCQACEDPANPQQGRVGTASSGAHKEIVSVQTGVAQPTSSAWQSSCTACPRGWTLWTSNRFGPGAIEISQLHRSQQSQGHLSCSKKFIGFWLGQCRCPFHLRDRVLWFHPTLHALRTRYEQRPRSARPSFVGLSHASCRAAPTAGPTPGTDT